jgi:hypothetical protein
MRGEGPGGGGATARAGSCREAPGPPSLGGCGGRREGVFPRRRPLRGSGPPTLWEQRTEPAQYFPLSWQQVEIMVVYPVVVTSFGPH